MLCGFLQNLENTEFVYCGGGGEVAEECGLEQIKQGSGVSVYLQSSLCQFRTRVCDVNSLYVKLLLMFCSVWVLRSVKGL